MKLANLKTVTPLNTKYLKQIAGGVNKLEDSTSGDVSSTTKDSLTKD